MRRQNKALPEVVPPRICITFRRPSSWFRPKTTKMWIFRHKGPKHGKYHVSKPWQRFSRITNLMKVGRNSTHIRLLGLRIKRFESQRCYQSNGTPPDPQNCHIKFKIDQETIVQRLKFHIMHGEKLCRFVVVSPREVRSLLFSCPFKMSVFRPVLKAPPIFLVQS